MAVRQRREIDLGAAQALEARAVVIGRVTPNLVDPEIVDQLAAFQFPPLTVDGLAASRQEREAMFLAALDVPTTVESVDHVVDEARGVVVRVHREPGASGPLPCLFSIHGGGYVMGTRLMDDPMHRAYCGSLGIVGASVEYRLSPETPYPGPLEDCYDGLAWVMANAADLGIDPDRVGIYGGSAGGHLSLLEAYKHHTPVNIKAVVDFFGPTDMADMYNNPGAYSPLAIAALLSGTPVSNPSMYQQSSPLTYVNSSSCPTIILQGGLDPLVNHVTQSEALRDKLTYFNIVNQYVYYPLGDHGNWDAATYTDAYNKIQVFLNANVH